ncbi:MFS transporter [Primorskyibacter flagellatus]|uniref:MFS transporter n=1 Tax=Primorskyibacter flagellatus TaxID=1387277 RepID=A0A917AGH3_9RHOB|nr:MFS transporter [Primorskyibacter flagellatus]GGE51043.1 MFS transporter [Primorskyibacter flagellatus]
MPRLGFSRIFQVLGQRNYGLFTLGNSLSLIGTWMQRIASGWLAWTLTESATWVGAIAFADLFPCVLLGPFSGAAADRWDRLKIMRIGQWLGLAQALLLCLLYQTGYLGIWPLFLITLFMGTVTGFLQPFRLAITSGLVTTEWLNTAIAINSVTFNLARFLGPAAAGLFIALGGLGFTYALNAVSFVIFAVTLSVVRLHNTTRRPSTGSFLHDTAVGIRHAVSTPGVNALLLITVSSGILVRPVVELLPGWAARVFHGTSGDFAALTSAFGIGAVMGGLWLASRGSARGLAAIMLGSQIAMCLVLLLFASSWEIWMALPLAMLIGAAMVIGAISAQTLTQMIVTDDLRGRVLGIWGLTIRGSPAVGALMMGAASDVWGMRLPLIVGVVLVLGLLGYYATRFDRLKGALEDGL